MNIHRPHPNIVIRTTVSVNLSPEQWRLGTERHSRVIMDKVADTMNKRITLLYNRGDMRDDARASFLGLVKDFEIYTTKDTVKVFDQLCQEIYRGDK